MTTDKGVAQYNETTNAFYHYSKADGLLRSEGALGTLLVGSQYTIVFPDGAETLDTSANVWQSRSIAVTQDSEKSTKVNVFGTFNGSKPYDFLHKQFARGDTRPPWGGRLRTAHGQRPPAQRVGLARLRTGRRPGHSRPAIQGRVYRQQDTTFCARSTSATSSSIAI